MANNGHFLPVFRKNMNIRSWAIINCCLKLKPDIVFFTINKEIHLVELSDHFARKVHWPCLHSNTEDNGLVCYLKSDYVSPLARIMSDTSTRCSFLLVQKSFVIFEDKLVFLSSYAIINARQELALDAENHPLISMWSCFQPFPFAGIPSTISSVKFCQYSMFLCLKL